MFNRFDDHSTKHIHKYEIFYAKEKEKRKNENEQKKNKKKYIQKIKLTYEFGGEN